MLLSIFAITTVGAQAASAEDIINAVELVPVKTGYEPLDRAVEEIFEKHFTDEMTTYDKLKVIYDYMIYNYAGGSGGNYASSTAADVKIDYSLGEMPDYYSSLDKEIVKYALDIIESHQGGCRYFSSASVVFFRALGFEAYRMYGSTAMSGGGMGVHWWPIIVIDDTSYIFDAQVDDHIANGGAIKYMRFFQSVTAMSAKYVVSGDEQQYIDEFKSFANLNSLLAKAEIDKVSVTSAGDELYAGETITISVKTAKTEDVDVFYTFSVKEDTFLQSSSINAWKTLADKSTANSIRWIPEKAGSYKIRVRIRDRKNLALLDSISVSADVIAPQAQSMKLLNASAPAIYLSDLLTLTLNPSDINNGDASDLMFTYSYILGSGTVKNIIKENTRDTQISFKPPAIGKYSFSVEIAGVPKSTYDNSSSISVDVVSKDSLGDVNRDGKISAVDARLALRAAVNISEIDSVSLLLADIDFNGNVNISDARNILRVAISIDKF